MGGNNLGSLWTGFQDVIFEGLQFLYGIVGDYGIAIVLLTVLLRLAMIPLTVKQTRSMYELQRVQPKIKALQEKYKNDKEKLQEETLKFYQENKVNPFGGCLPTLLQMPVFFALFRVLGGTADKPGHLMSHIANLEAGGTLSAAKIAAMKSFWFILPDITQTPSSIYASDGLMAAIPYLLFVALFGLSVWLPQKLMPASENQQVNIAGFMAIMMLYFGWISPAGVLIYWVTSSVIGIIQQQAQTRLYSRKEEQA